MYHNAAKAYGTQQIQGASPAMQVALLYERAVSSLHEAIDAIQRGDVQARWVANKRASDIVTALMSALDQEKGGEIAQSLDQLYSYLLRQLVTVDVRNDPKPAEEAIEILKPLRDAWLDLARNQKPESPAEPGAEQTDRARQSSYA